jgi:outer membrane protein assembly factor BamB
MTRHVAPVLLTTLLTAALFAPASRAQEWDRFRGPGGAGHADANTALPAQWTDKDLAWRIDLPGIGHSSPVVWGERVFVTTCDEDATKRTLVCVRATDGQTLWQREWPSRSFEKHANNSFASITPALDAERVYLLWSTPEHFSVIALDHDGKDVWQRDLGPYKANHAAGASPILYEDLLIVPNDQDGPSSIVALDKRTGAVRWQTPRKTTRFSASTPAV